jgi:hypothetical protein
LYEIRMYTPSSVSVETARAGMKEGEERTPDSSESPAATTSAVTASWINTGSTLVKTAG